MINIIVGVNDCLIFRAEYSYTTKSCTEAAAMATQRACPNNNEDFILLL